MVDYWKDVPDIDEAFGGGKAMNIRRTKKSEKRDREQVKSLSAAEAKAEELSAKNSNKTVFMYRKDGEWIVTLTDPKITGMIKPKQFKNGNMVMK